MATNSYFNHYQHVNEQKLFDDLSIESIQIAGIDVLYIPRENVAIDPLLGEPVQSTFTSYYPIEVYMKNVSGFDGQGDFLSKFGIAAENNVQLIVSKTRFESLNIPDRPRPLEGDLIYFGIPTAENPTGYGSYMNDLFLITFADREDPERFWQNGVFYAFTMNCSLFTQSYEKFQTGHAALDQFDPSNDLQDVELSFGVNEHTADEENTLLDFSETNPFGDL